MINDMEIERYNKLKRATEKRGIKRQKKGKEEKIIHNLSLRWYSRLTSVCLAYSEGWCKGDGL